MGHGKSTAIEDHGYSEILRKLECGCKWWDNTVWLQKPGLMGVRKQQCVFYVCLSLHVHVWICTHMHMWTLHGQDPDTQLLDADRGIKGASTMNQVKFPSEYLSLFFLPPSSRSRCLAGSGPLEKEAKSTLSPEDPASHVGELSSTPHLSLNISAVFHAFQAKCSGAAQQSTSFPIISTPIMDQYFIIEFQANIQRNNRWWAFWVGN